MGFKLCSRFTRTPAGARHWQANRHLARITLICAVIAIDNIDRYVVMDISACVSQKAWSFVIISHLLRLIKSASHVKCHSKLPRHQQCDNSPLVACAPSLSGCCLSTAFKRSTNRSRVKFHEQMQWFGTPRSRDSYFAHPVYFLLSPSC